MREEVRAFFELNRLPVDKLVYTGRRRGFEKAAVLRACEEVYDEGKLMGFWGAEIEPIRLAWRVFTKAKVVEVERGVEEVDRIEELKALSESLRKEIGDLRESMVPWYEKLWRRIR